VIAGQSASGCGVCPYGMLKTRERGCYTMAGDRLNGNDRQQARPTDPELFSRTAPRWNCVDYPNEGMHYTSGKHGGCAWCGKTREQIAAEPSRSR
jgi:hypothetical protein